MKEKRLKFVKRVKYFFLALAALAWASSLVPLVFHGFGGITGPQLVALYVGILFAIIGCTGAFFSLQNLQRRIEKSLPKIV
jgi:hypothetical protein